MKKSLFLALAFVFVLTTSAFAANYVKPDEFRKWLESGKSMIIVDIQTKEDFEKHHFKGSIETNAYPVKTDDERRRLDAAVSRANASKDDVVIICPRGKGGAMNTYEYLKSKGIPENRLYVLEGGIGGWPYKEMLIKGR